MEHKSITLSEEEALLIYDIAYGINSFMPVSDEASGILSCIQSKLLHEFHLDEVLKKKYNS